jgi:hypothetical protein
MPEDVLFQVVLPEGSKDPSAAVPFPVEQHLEVLIPAQPKILLLSLTSVLEVYRCHILFLCAKQ